MKKLLLLIVFATIIISGFGQPLRPPIETKETRTSILKWRSLEMSRDSLPYWFPINNNSFSLSRPDGSGYQTYSFASDSVYWEGGDIYVCEGCNIYYNDSVFLVRRDPACSNCWQYSYNNGIWRDLFCEPLMNRVFEIIPSSKTVLKEGDYLDWLDETNLRAGVTYMGFKRNEANVGKFLTYDDDSVRWGDPTDSIFQNGNWYALPDTLPVLHDTITINSIPLTDGDSIEVDPSSTNELDSIRINNIWYGGGDTYTPIDNSITNELDSFYVENLERWISGGESVDLFWRKSYGDTYTPSTMRVGIGGHAPAWGYMLSVYNKSDAVVSGAIYADASLTDGIAVNAYTTNNWAINANSNIGSKINKLWLGDVADSTYRMPIKKGGYRWVLAVSDSSNNYTDFLPIDSLLGNLADRKVVVRDSINSTESLPLYLASEDFTIESNSHGYYRARAKFPAASKWTSVTNGIYRNGNVAIGSMVVGTAQRLSIEGENNQDGLYIATTGGSGDGIIINATSGRSIYALTSTGTATTIEAQNGGSGSALSGSAGSGVGVAGTSVTGYSGYFTGGLGLKVGTSGTAITRTGSMASFDFWYGTQAEWTANTPKNGVYPQASTTFWTIKN